MKLDLDPAEKAGGDQKQSGTPDGGKKGKPKTGVREPPCGKRCFVGGLSRDLFHRKQRLNTKSVERISHEEGDPEIGHLLERLRLRTEER